MSSENINEHLLGFLHAAEASLHIRQHRDLLMWLQGDVQRYLPHQILIAGWGNVSGCDVIFDVMSPLPGIRTEDFYNTKQENCCGRTECLLDRPAGAGCPTPVTFLKLLRDRWHAQGRSPLVAYCDQDRLTDNLVCGQCNQRAADVVRSMRSVMIHGYADQRGDVDCIFVFMSLSDLAHERFQRSVRFLLPYLDQALRQVSLLHWQVSSKSPDPEPAEPGDSGLSVREQEIMEWVRIGKTNYEIGMILDISAFTVKNHLQRIFKKLEVTNRAQAVARLSPVAKAR